MTKLVQFLAHKEKNGGRVLYREGMGPRDTVALPKPAMKRASRKAPKPPETWWQQKKRQARSLWRWFLFYCVVSTMTVHAAGIYYWHSIVRSIAGAHVATPATAVHTACITMNTSALLERILRDAGLVLSCKAPDIYIAPQLEPLTGSSGILKLHLKLTGAITRDFVSQSRRTYARTDGKKPSASEQFVFLSELINDDAAFFTNVIKAAIG